MGFEHAFDCVTFKHMDPLMKQIQSQIVERMQCGANFDNDRKD